MSGVAAAVRGDRAHFSVRLVPRASRTVLAGIRDGALVAKVTAAPVGGAANAALLKLLAARLGLAPSTIRIESGATSQLKRLSIPAAGMERLRAL